MSEINATTFQEAPHYRPLDRILGGEKMAQAATDLLRLPSDVTQAAFHTAVQTPINSLTQMVAPDYLPKVQIIEAPETVPELSPRWHAQQLGSALGAAADIAAIELACKGTMPPALLGACYDGLLRPADISNGKNQFVERAKNAAVGAVGFGMLYGTSSALSGLSKNVESAAWKSIASNKVINTTVAGIPAGLVTTALSGGTSAHDLAIGTYTSAIQGLGLGAIHAAGERQAMHNRQNEELVQLRVDSVTDYLTSLGNRRGTDVFLQKEFDRSVRTGGELSLVYGDMDGLKKINDNLGHRAGSEAIAHVGHGLKGELRSYDYAARIGGDEFAIILPDTDLATAQILATRLEKAVKTEIGEGKNSQPLGISLGVVSRGLGDTSWKAFEERADDEMFRVKGERKKQINL
jgi:diguanylate cyclase (GGDEF)-like protein